MRKKWVVAAKKADFEEIGAHFGIDPVIARVMRNRDMTDLNEMEVYLHGGKKDLHDPHLLRDVEKAASIIAEKTAEKKKTRIIGDYDIDGVQATYILFVALRRMGAIVDTVLPDRVLDGYGLNEHLVTKAHEDGIDMILTCDNGISAPDEIREAKELGMTVVVTDHHEVPFEETDSGRRELLPGADAVVNPRQRKCGYPFPDLCGAGVAFKLVQVLYERAGIPVSEADVFLENVGFATVGDVVDLRGENRVFVRLGLEMLSRTKNKGMRALITQTKLDPSRIKSYHIGFILGPCINVGGRLDTARLSLRLLLSEEEEEAAALAEEIVALNEKRKSLTEGAVDQARRIIEENGYDKGKVIVVFLEDCHESLAGIVAGRIREAYYHPVFVLTGGADGYKGSGRSIEGYSMYEEISRCGDLFKKFGGHPMAAGFTLKKDGDVDTLRSRLNAQSTLTGEDLMPKVVIDVPMPVDYLREGLVSELEQLEPFGKGNKKPVFADRNLEIESLKILGKDGRVMRMKLKSARGRRLDAVCFGDPGDLRLALEEKYGGTVAEDVMQGRCAHRVTLDFTYYPEMDHYFEQPRLQLNITGFCGV